jgi:Vps4 C terminal oligomerisation domain
VSALTERDLRPVALRDFRAACQAQKASVQPAEIERYITYDAKHGARQMAAAEMEEGDDGW